jgi:hypothetical protein
MKNDATALREKDLLSRVTRPGGSFKVREKLIRRLGAHVC